LSFIVVSPSKTDAAFQPIAGAADDRDVEPRHAFTLVQRDQQGVDERSGDIAAAPDRIA
jgi:hypothetical protein